MLHGEDFILVSISHLHKEILEDVGDVPVLLGGRFVEREAPFVHELSDFVPGDLSFVNLRGKILSIRALW